MKKTIKTETKKVTKREETVRKPTKPAAKKPIRDKKVYFRVTEKELKKIDAAAKKAKMTRSEYIRSKVLV